MNYFKEQFYIIKKQLEEVTNTQELANRKSISSRQEELDYLREEDHTKSQIISNLLT